MDVNKQYNYQKMSGSDLIVFCLLVSLSCTNPSEIKDLSVKYSDDEAIHVTFKSNGDTGAYKVFLKGNTTTPVLGSFIKEDENDVFKPIIPFSSGMSYELRHQNQTIIEFTINETVENAEKARISGLEVSFNSQGTIGKVELTSLIGYTYMKPLSLNADSQ